MAMCQCDISCDMSQYDTSLTVINASTVVLVVIMLCDIPYLSD